MLLLASKEIGFKLQPVAQDTSTESDHPISKVPPSSPGSPPKRFRRAGSLPPPFPRHPPQSPYAAGPSRTQAKAPWQNVDLSTWRFPDNPFQRVFVDLADLQTRYYRLEHITRGAYQALNDCNPGNILRKQAKRADRKELDQAKKELKHIKTENAQLNVQVSAMAQELNQKSEEIRKYHAEQAVVFRQIRELIGQPAEAITKARLYDQLMKSGDPIQARQTIPILVKYSRLMNGLFKDIQKLVPLGRIPRRVLYQAPPGSPTRTLYEALGEVAIMHNPPTAVEPGEGSRPRSTGKHRKGPVLPSLDGRIPGQIGPDGVNHLSAGPPTGPELWTGTKLQSDDILRSERRLRKWEVPNTPIFSSGMYDAGSSSHHLQGTVDLGDGSSCVFMSSGITNRK